jgi:hypothetical protein
VSHPPQTRFETKTLLLIAGTRRQCNSAIGHPRRHPQRSPSSGAHSLVMPHCADDGRLADVCARTREASKQLRRFQQQARRQRHCPPTVTAAAEMLALAVPDDCRSTKAFLQRYHCEAAAGETAKIVAWRESLTADDVRWELQRPLTHRRALGARRSELFQKEAALHDWVEAQNFERGLAPAASTIWSAASSGSISGWDPAATAAASGRARRQWLRRWRLRWAVRLGRVPARDDPPAAEMRKKVGRVRRRQGAEMWCGRADFWDRILVRLAARKTGPLDAQTFASSENGTGKCHRDPPRDFEPWLRPAGSRLLAMGTHDADRGAAGQEDRRTQSR